MHPLLGAMSLFHSDQGIQESAAAYMEPMRPAGAEASLAEIGEPQRNGYGEQLI